jgi:hypothetical protein
MLETGKMRAAKRTRAGSEALYAGEAMSAVAYASEVYIDKHPSIASQTAGERVRFTISPVAASRTN